MRYLLVHRTSQRRPAGGWPAADFLHTIRTFLTAANRSGVLLAAEQLHDPRNGRTLAVTGGRAPVPAAAPGPPWITGFALIAVKSHEEALIWAERFAACFSNAEVEVQAVHDPLIF